MGDNWERDINILEKILDKTARMQKSEIEAIVGMLKLKKDNNQIDNLTVTVLDSILRNNKNLSDESMEKTRDAIMAEFKSNGGAKRKKKRRKTKRKKGRKSKRKRTRKRRRKSMRKRRRKKTR
jgi:hypothetical protein